MTSIRVSHELNQKVQQLKVDLGLSSAEDVMWRLIMEYEDQGASNSSASSSEASSSAPAGGAEKNKRVQLLSYKDLAGSPAAIKHLTGLKPEPAKWMWKNLGEAVMTLSCFCMLLFSPAPVKLRAQHFAFSHSLFTLVSQIERKLAPAPGVRRKSNSGHRQLCLEDRILLFLWCIWRKTPYLGLAIFFGVSEGTSINYYEEVLGVYSEFITPRLLYPLSAAQITPMLSDEVKADLPGCLFVVDGTGLKKNSKENSLVQRIMWSAYHHGTEYSIVVSKFGCSISNVFACFHVLIPFQ